MSQRRRISTKERLTIFTRENGICHICCGRIVIGEAWDISHEIALELGGDDSGSNLRVAHRKCHRGHTSEKDIPAIARAKRIERKHIGITKSKRSIASRGFQRSERMKEKTTKQDALRAMRESGPARIGPFKVAKPDPYGRPKWKAELRRHKANQAKRNGKKGGVDAAAKPTAT
jgi:5-methylcytosine-specific restriction protein A